MNTTKTISVLIVDDHKIVIQGLTMLLEKEADINVVGSAQNTFEALKQIEECSPDVAVVDLSLQTNSGIDFIKDIKSHHPNVLTIVLSMHDEQVYAKRAIRAGARGYVMKDESFDTVADAIRIVVNGDIFASEAVKNELLQSLSTPPHQNETLDLSSLSDREMEVLKLIGKGLRPRHIAEELCLSVSTVDTYCQRIRQKLNVEKMKDLIQLSSVL